jgi:phosphinothricin acetyltransferase
VSAPAGKPAPFALRDSEPADIPAIAAIYAHYVATSTATFDEAPPPPEEMAQRRAELVATGLPFIVATGGAGRILGYAYAAPFRPRSGYRFTLEDSIYIDPAAIRGGIGAGLLARLIERCAAGGYRQLMAVIGDTAHAASIRLHEKLGFERVGLMPAIGFKFGRWIDVVTMQRALGAGGTATLPER